MDVQSLIRFVDFHVASSGRCFSWVGARWPLGRLCVQEPSARERALLRALSRALPLRPAAKLDELALCAAQAELLALRRPELLAVEEPDEEPELEKASGGTQVAQKLWRCVPASELYEVRTLHTVLRLSEAGNCMAWLQRVLFPSTRRGAK